MTIIIIIVIIIFIVIVIIIVIIIIIITECCKRWQLPGFSLNVLSRRASGFYVEEKLIDLNFFTA